MEAVREVTVWTGVEYRQPNHDYLLDGDRIVAYRPWGTDEVRVLSGKIKIDRRGRKFVEVKQNSWKFDLTLVAAKEEPEKPAGQVWEVAGSKGNKYFVNLSAGHWSCTCPGHGFRGKCRHVDEIKVLNSD